MFHWTCTNCQHNNTTTDRTVSRCKSCLDEFFLDGDAQLAQHDWIVETYDRNIGWLNTEVEPFMIDNLFHAERPVSFETIHKAFDSIVKSSPSDQRFTHHRIVNIKSGLVVGPMDFTAVKTYRPGIAQGTEQVLVLQPAVASKPEKKTRKKSTVN